MRTAAARRAAWAAAPLLAAACAAAPRPVDAAATAPPAVAVPGDGSLATRHAALLDIVRRADRLEIRDGTIERGGVSSLWRAHLDPDGAAFIEVRRGLGGRGLSLARYYFDAGRLLFFQEQGERLDESAVPPVRRSFYLDLLFDPDGSVRSMTSRVDGRDEAPDPARLGSLREEAAALRRLAPAGRLIRPASPEGPPPEIRMR